MQLSPRGDALGPTEAAIEMPRDQQKGSETMMPAAEYTDGRAPQAEGQPSHCPPDCRGDAAFAENQPGPPDVAMLASSHEALPGPPLGTSPANPADATPSPHSGCFPRAWLSHSQ